MKQAVMLLCLILLSLLTACATPKIRPSDVEQVIRSELSFIRDGVTTREDVLLKLGTPSAQFEAQRILTYQLREDKDGRVHVFWPRHTEVNPSFTHLGSDIYSLVLVFGSNGVLERHSLVVSK